ncbi:MAG: rRNA maturation RNase YbeY [Armatimonadetes bacterium]|nr:rRNA maturation RNase YbeY [Armatimonadota bacterium]
MPVELDVRHPGYDAGSVDFGALCRQVCFDELGCEPTVAVVLCDDDTIAEVNWTWLEHEGPTDVISFPQFDLRPGQPAPPIGHATLLGDIIISVDTAAEQAAAYGVTSPSAWGTDSEVALLFVHGLLHLCGWDDQTPDQRTAMQAREDLHLAAVGLGPAPRAD